VGVCIAGSGMLTQEISVLLLASNDFVIFTWRRLYFTWLCRQTERQFLCINGLKNMDDDDRKELAVKKRIFDHYLDRNPIQKAVDADEIRKGRDPHRFDLQRRIMEHIKKKMMETEQDLIVGILKNAIGK
jgi:hypothetical protein